MQIGVKIHIKNYPYTFLFNVMLSNKRNPTRSYICTVEIQQIHINPHKTQQKEQISPVTGLNDGTGCGTRCTDRDELFKVQIT